MANTGEHFPCRLEMHSPGLYSISFPCPDWMLLIIVCFDRHKLARKRGKEGEWGNTTRPTTEYDCCPKIVSDRWWEEKMHDLTGMRLGQWWLPPMINRNKCQTIIFWTMWRNEVSVYNRCSSLWPVFHLVGNNQCDIHLELTLSRVPFSLSPW